MDEWSFRRHGFWKIHAAAVFKDRYIDRFCESQFSEPRWTSGHSDVTDSGKIHAAAVPKGRYIDRFCETQFSEPRWTSGHSDVTFM